MSEALLATNVVALAAAVVWLAFLVLPMRRMVRARNAFLLRRGHGADFLWTPAAIPSGFRAERESAPKVIADAVAEAGVLDRSGDWPRALALVDMLVRHSRHEGGIQADLVTTYESIVAGNGYCADFVRVYMAAARQADLFCRQWAFSFDGFGGHGHTFVEVYDRQRGAWVFLDVHNNVYAAVGDEETPVEALRLHAALLDSPSTVRFLRAGPGRLGWEHPEKLLAYYVRGVDQWYLWWGNDVVSRERHGLIGAIGRMSGRLSYRLGNALGAVPPMVVLASPSNEQAIIRAERLRRWVVGVSLLAIGLFALLLVRLGWR